MVMAIMKVHMLVGGWYISSRRELLFPRFFTRFYTA